MVSGRQNPAHTGTGHTPARVGQVVAGAVRSTVGIARVAGGPWLHAAFLAGFHQRIVVAVQLLEGLQGQQAIQRGHVVDLPAESGDGTRPLSRANGGC